MFIVLLPLQWNYPSALKIQCHIVKNTLIQIAYSAILPTGYIQRKVVKTSEYFITFIYTDTQVRPFAVRFRRVPWNGYNVVTSVPDRQTVAPQERDLEAE